MQWLLPGMWEIPCAYQSSCPTPIITCHAHLPHLPNMSIPHVLASFLFKPKLSFKIMKINFSRHNCTQHCFSWWWSLRYFALLMLYSFVLPYSLICVFSLFLLKNMCWARSDHFWSGVRKWCPWARAGHACSFTYDPCMTAFTLPLCVWKSIQFPSLRIVKYGSH